MLQNCGWDGRAVSTEQNAELEAYNIVRLKTLCGRVPFGGSATVKIAGKHFL